MLSCMREQSGQGNSQASQDGQVKEQNSNQSPGDEDELLTVSSRSSQVKKTTKLLAVLFGVGLLCLFLMIKNSSPSKASAKSQGTQGEQKKLELAMAKLTGGRSKIFDQMDKLLSRFDELSRIEQVKVSELVKNPFATENFINQAGSESEDEEDDSYRSELLRQQQVRSSSKDLHLLSVMDTAEGPCCMINDKMLRVGDTIKNFKVRRITNNSVELGSQGIVFTLKIAQ